jgi:hypothetical protein
VASKIKYRGVLRISCIKLYILHVLLYTHTYIYTYVYIYIDTYIHTCIHTYISSHLHIQVDRWFTVHIARPWSGRGSRTKWRPFWALASWPNGLMIIRLIYWIYIQYIAIYISSTSYINIYCIQWMIDSMAMNQFGSIAIYIASLGNIHKSRWFWCQLFWGTRFGPIPIYTLVVVAIDGDTPIIGSIDNEHLLVIWGEVYDRGWYRLPTNGGLIFKQSRSSLVE